MHAALEVLEPRAIRRRAPALLATAPWLVMASAFLHAAWGGWGMWGDLFVDTGRELDLPRRLLAGAP